MGQTPTKKRVTMRDVADLAEVSPTAVSFVFSGNGRVSDQTVKSVLAAAEKLDYRPPRQNFKNAPNRTYTVRAGGGEQPPKPQRDLDEEIDFVRVEFEQRHQEGYDVGHLEALIKNIVNGNPTFSEIENARLQLETSVPRPDFPYVEPSDWQGIRAEQKRVPQFNSSFTADKLFDRIYGGWLGRCSGCMLGRPLENIDHDRNSYLIIEELLRNGGVYPLTDYVPEIIPHSSDIYGEAIEWMRSMLRGNIRFTVNDDDLDYTILNLIALEKSGSTVTSEQIAQTWLWNLPYNGLYTAEHITYRNLVNNFGPPDSATHHNPFREYIGAQIRADMFGYTAPGLPDIASERAWRDARISHVKNGIYGEMMVAAMIAAAFCTDDIETVVEAGVSVVPARSRLAQALNKTIAYYRTTANWHDGITFLASHFSDYDWIHTLPNACIVVHALLVGRGDFENSIVTAAMSGMDTDCNCATVGSILGVMTGAANLPAKWIAPLNDRLLSRVANHSDNRISDLAQRTLRIAMNTLSETRGRKS